MKTKHSNIIAILFILSAILASCATKRNAAAVTATARSDTAEQTHFMTKQSMTIDSIMSVSSLSIDSIEVITSVMWLPIDSASSPTCIFGDPSSETKSLMVPWVRKKVSMHGVGVNRQSSQKKVTSADEHDSLYENHRWHSYSGSVNSQTDAKDLRPPFAMYFVQVLYSIIAIMAIIAIIIFLRRKLKE